MERTRQEELRVVFFPIMYEWYEWKVDPTIFVPGTDFDDMLDQYKRGHKVTPEEWARLEKEYDMTPEEIKANGI